MPTNINYGVQLHAMISEEQRAALIEAVAAHKVALEEPMSLAAYVRAALWEKIQRDRLAKKPQPPSMARPEASEPEPEDADDADDEILGQKP